MGLLENKIAIITGGGRGIGKAIAHRYSEEGATVIIAEFDEQSGQELLTQWAVTLSKQTLVTKKASLHCLNM